MTKFLVKTEFQAQAEEEDIRIAQDVANGTLPPGQCQWHIVYYVLNGLFSAEVMALKSMFLTSSQSLLTSSAVGPSPGTRR